MAIALLIFLLILLLVKSYFIFVDKHINRKIVNAIYIFIRTTCCLCRFNKDIKPVLCSGQHRSRHPKIVE